MIFDIRNAFGKVVRVSVLLKKANIRSTRRTRFILKTTGHGTWVNYIWKIINSFTRATLSNICHYYDPLTQSIQGIEPKVCQSIILSGPEVDLFMTSDTSVEEGKVSWEHTYHVQHKGESPEEKKLVTF